MRWSKPYKTDKHVAFVSSTLARGEYESTSANISVCIIAIAGYAHVSRDQVADHQKTTKKAGHSRSRCQIFMVSGDQFPTFRDAMNWSTDVTFGPLLPVTRKISRVVVTPRPSINPPVDRRPVTATVTSSQPLATGYRIPKRIRISPTLETDDSPA